MAFVEIIKNPKTPEYTLANQLYLSMEIGDIKVITDSCIRRDRILNRFHVISRTSDGNKKEFITRTLKDGGFTVRRIA